ncbi:hypothetical protein [Glaciibacter sp. 2TAF33]|uniref:hypothetical protein n=1 Tax=Glaciibacter sp. 2TAF33 TaxID=3233015 RepID=UPI003F8E2FAC
MPALQTPPATPGGLILSSDIRSALGADFRLRRQAESGRFHRVSRGVYFDARNWAELNVDQRYALRVRGAALERRGTVALSHHSAAVLWGLPILVPWPAEVHFITDRAAGGRSNPGIRRHTLGLTGEDVTEIDGLLLTTVNRTVVDLAATIDLKSGVAVVDRALLVDRRGRYAPLTTKAELRATWERMLPFRGSTRARAIIEFGTHLSGSPLESGSRVNIALSGFPEPELQHPFSIEGSSYETDFYWRDFDAVGEADGRGKYFDPRMLAGKSTGEAIFLEKEREDAIRREVKLFTRWNASIGLNQAHLRSRLVNMGLPTGRRRLRAS